jgi:hypothetical protein
MLALQAISVSICPKDKSPPSKGSDVNLTMWQQWCNLISNGVSMEAHFHNFRTLRQKQKVDVCCLLPCQECTKHHGQVHDVGANHACSNDVGCEVGVERPLGCCHAKDGELLKAAANGGDAANQGFKTAQLLQP